MGLLTMAPILTITCDMNNLTISESYHGGEELTVGNDFGLSITTTDYYTLAHYKFEFHLNNILHCLKANANLLFV